MLRHLGGKGVHAVLVLLMVSFLTAILLDLAPGDPAYAVLGEDATPEAVAAVHADLGLDRPVYERYFDWLTDVIRADFGESYRANVSEAARQSVTHEIGRALPVTLELMALSILLALAIAIPLGIYTGYKQGGLVDRVWLAISSALVSAPPFVTVPLLVYVFVLKLGLFPATGWIRLTDDPIGNLEHIFLPALALALETLPRFSAVLRSDIAATLQEDFILNARAKGLRQRTVLLRHALRPSSFSLLTMSGISIGHLIGGAVVVEFLFAFPGLGSLMYSAIQARDINTVQGVVMFIALSYVVINALIDMAYAYLDPRVRLRVSQ